MCREQRLRLREGQRVRARELRLVGRAVGLQLLEHELAATQRALPALDGAAQAAESREQFLLLAAQLLTRVILRPKRGDLRARRLNIPRHIGRIDGRERSGCREAHARLAALARLFPLRLAAPQERL